jgi:putative endonuclease
MFTVYVLYSPSSNKTYTGYTSDIDSRLRSHNVMANKGFTVKYRPWVLIYSEEFSTKTDAIKRENELKTGKGRTFIKGIVKEKFGT